ncbi:hypothetical protein IMZ11_36525 [Microtetraspora sp. AC03309]|uniref:hypothetical protein n=1 Tax=Microtetraspora sp. AC03309 TaxID=2779376 RepID=UPI001E48DF78|nr:hypothetical protein [Microtetraspora sp. AC03309]MCC5581130.1 hypothetical protein [Microtetraspora sp. AC03309]
MRPRPAREKRAFPEPWGESRRAELGLPQPGHPVPPYRVDRPPSGGGRRAALASTVASRSLAVSGPRTLMRSEYLMRMNGAAPPGLATRGFGRLLRALSSRI